MATPTDVTLQLPVALVERLVSVLERMEQHFSGKAALSPDAPRLLTADDVARQLGKSRRDVERMVKAGKLRKVPNLGKRTTRFRPADVGRFLSAGETKPGSRRL